MILNIFFLSSKLGLHIDVGNLSLIYCIKNFTTVNNNNNINNNNNTEFDVESDPCLSDAAGTFK